MDNKCDKTTGECIEGDTCSSGYQKDSSTNLCVKCVWNKGATTDNRVCKLSGENGYDDTKDICKGYVPNASSTTNPGECDPCSSGEYSLDGKTCIKCNCMNNKCDKTTGECTEGETCSSGYKKDSITNLCVNECSYDETDQACKKFELDVCIDFEPVSSKTDPNSYKCQACKDSTSPDGKKCVKTSSSSSSGGLSGGAIAGIVVAGVVVVGVIGFAIFFVSKGASLFGAVNAGTATYSQSATSSLSNINPSNKH